MAIFRARAWRRDSSFPRIMSMLSSQMLMIWNFQRKTARSRHTSRARMENSGTRTKSGLPSLKMHASPEGNAPPGNRNMVQVPGPENAPGFHFPSVVVVIRGIFIFKERFHVATPGQRIEKINAVGRQILMKNHQFPFHAIHGSVPFPVMLPHLSGKSGSRFPNARTTKGKPHGMVLRAAQRQQFLIGVLENAVQTAFEEGNPWREERKGMTCTP